MTLPKAILAPTERGACALNLMVIGFPKSGTTTIQRALEASGLTPLHWKTKHGIYAGDLIYTAVMRGLDPFAHLTGYDAVTQPDVIDTRLGLNLWPQLDIPLLLEIRRRHPECRFVLNYRDPVQTARSIWQWKDMGDRILNVDVPGLPRGYGNEDHLARWIESHFAACRRIFSGDPHFLELDIERTDAPDLLGRALGIPIRGWGHFNKRSEMPAEWLKSSGQSSP